MKNLILCLSSFFPLHSVQIVVFSMHPEIEHAVYILLKMQTVKEFVYTPDPSDH